MRVNIFIDSVIIATHTDTHPQDWPFKAYLIAATLLLYDSLYINVCCGLISFLSRKKQKTYGNLAGTLEMETYQKGPLVFICTHLVMLYTNKALL